MFAEEGILRDTERTEESIAACDAGGVVNHTSSIARRAHRVLQVAQQEAENSEDPTFVGHVNDGVARLRSSRWRHRANDVSLFAARASKSPDLAGDRLLFV